MTRQVDDVAVPAAEWPAGPVVLIGGPRDGKVIQAEGRPVIRLRTRTQVLDYRRDPEVPTRATFVEPA